MMPSRQYPFAENRCCALLLSAAVLLIPAGCSGTGLFHRSKTEIPTADANNPVVRALCMWEPAEGNGLDGLPTRGFAGQILFFTRGKATPVRVDGDVRVYLYDNHGTPEEQGKPIHQFDFRGDAWTVHLQPSTLGPSYQVFIPYTRKQPWHATCGLRVRLMPKEGQTIYSELVQVTLPGPLKQSEDKNAGPALAPLAKKPIDLSDLQLGAIVKQSTVKPAALGEPLAVAAVTAAHSESAGPQPHEPARLDPQTTARARKLKLQEIEQLVEEYKRTTWPSVANAPAEPIAQPDAEPQRRFRLAPADDDD